MELSDALTASTKESLVDSGQSQTAANRLNAALAMGLVLLGVLFRLRQFLFDRSLWLDESLIALNIIRRTPAELFGPLDNHQGAPIAFLLLEKAAVYLFGTGELALRLVPCLCGIISIFLFARVARRFLASPAFLIALALFALCGPLLYYSSEVKQYSSDVFAAVTLLLVATPIEERFYRGAIGTAVAAIVGAVAVWCSYPAIFILAGVGAALLCKWLWHKDKRAMLPLFVLGAIWSISFLACYMVTMRRLSGDSFLLSYWHDAFAPLNPLPIANLLWYPGAFLCLFSGPLGLTFCGIAGIATILGAVSLYHEHRDELPILVAPALCALLASGLHRYPFQGRFLLFLVPFILLVMAEGLGMIIARTHSLFPALGALLAGFLLFHPVLSAAQTFRRPAGVEEIRPVLRYIEAHRQQGDILYCYYSARHPLEYYRLRQTVGSMPEIEGAYGRDDWKAYREDLDKLKGRGRVWLLFSHVWRSDGVDEERLFLDYLDGLGRRLESSQEPGASTYLYDLGLPGDPPTIPSSPTQPPGR